MSDGNTFLEHEEFIEWAGSEAQEYWTAGSIPTVREFGEFLGVCVAHYMETEYE